MTIERAGAEDFDAVSRLLEANGLPLAGLPEHMQDMIVAREDGRIVGSAAIEVYADGALLRSVAVDPAMRGRGLGHDLTETAVRIARDRSVPAVYLLTTSAERFFPKLGFSVITRKDVPASVRESVEFAVACPASAIVMWKQL